MLLVRKIRKKDSVTAANAHSRRLIYWNKSCEISRVWITELLFSSPTPQIKGRLRSKEMVIVCMNTRSTKNLWEKKLYLCEIMFQGLTSSSRRTQKKKNRLGDGCGTHCSQRTLLKSISYSICLSLCADWSVGQTKCASAECKFRMISGFLSS